jgi:3-keto-L-gulonate-6-phosphate decarboxylase
MIMISMVSFSQNAPADLEELKKQILALNQNVDQIQLNLSTAEKKFKRGILIATLGYTMTITGGMMLGRENDKVGQGLLIAGGATGAVGTVLMLDSFKYLGRAGRKNNK